MFIVMGSQNIPKPPEGRHVPRIRVRQLGYF